MAQAPVNPNVVILMPEGVNREPLRKLLGEAGYKAAFAQDAQNAKALIGNLKPTLFVQDWSSLDFSQSCKFQQMLGSSTDQAGMKRIVFIEAITPAIMALALETGITKVVAKAEGPPGIVEAIKSVAKAEAAIAPEVRAVMDLKANPGKVSQDTFDKTVEAAFKAHGKDPMARLEYGNLCVRLGKLEEASSVALDLISENPGNLRAMNLLSRVFMKQGDFDSALKALGKADAMSPSNPERLALLGESFYKKGDLVKAKAQFEEAISVDANQKDAKKGLGIIKLSEGDTNGAIDMFKNSVSEEEVAGFFNNAAVHAVRSKKFEEALRLYASALSAVTTDKFKPIIYFNMALNHRRMSNLEEAQKALHRALKIDPKMERAAAQLAEVQVLLKKKAG